MRKASKFVLKNWLWITLGIILTKFAVEYAYQERGYLAYGGELLTLPIMLMAVSLARDVIGSIKVIFREREEDVGWQSMCEICRQNPCHPRCPNAGEPEGKYKCIKCGYGIMENEEYLASPDGPICLECLEDMATREVIEICGEELQRA